MNDLLTILYFLNDTSEVSQRDIAQATNISLGKINQIIKRLVEHGYVEAEKAEGMTRYHVTSKGIELMAQDRKESALKKIRLTTSPKQPKLAVILAAGQPRNLNIPVPLIALPNQTLLERTISVLTQQGIERIIVVAGYQETLLAEAIANDARIELVSNTQFAKTGTMASLAAAASLITEDFLLIEGDLLFEARGIRHLCDMNGGSGMLITAVRESRDEAMVEVRNGQIIKMGKDIHKFNRIDGEMIGLSKISYPFFQRMMSIYAENDNPWVNYEYIMLDVAQQFHLGYVKLDDFVWGEIDDAVQSAYLLNFVYPTIVRKEEAAAIQEVAQFLVQQFEAQDKEIQKIEHAGGMTNKNFHVQFRHEPYIVRLAGNGTSQFINRESERLNSRLAQVLELDAPTIFFDQVTGTKMSRLIPNAETLNKVTAKYPQAMQHTTQLLRRLHQSGLEFANTFNVFQEIEKYETLVDELKLTYPEDYFDLRAKVMAFRQVLRDWQVPLVPCHIDTVPENFVRSSAQPMFLIDWEYSGMNDCAWDLAAHSLECEFSEEDEQQFLTLYGEGVSPSQQLQQRILIFKICQDFLWSLWTLYKEGCGDDFGQYGPLRYARAKENLQRYEMMRWTT